MRAISTIAAVGATAGLLLTSAGAATNGGSVSLVAYSTPKEAYGQLVDAFGKTKAGKGVSFTQSYGASGDQAQAVVNGLHADVVAFSLEPDVTTLVKARLVSPSWSKNRWHGMVTRAFVGFLHGAKAQTIFGQNGYRPVLRSVVKKFNYPVRPWLFTIQKLGGWAQVEKRFFDPKNGVMAKIEASLGK